MQPFAVLLPPRPDRGPGRPAPARGHGSLHGRCAHRTRRPDVRDGADGPGLPRAAHAPGVPALRARRTGAGPRAGAGQRPDLLRPEATGRRLRPRRPPRPRRSPRRTRWRRSPTRSASRRRRRSRTSRPTPIERRPANPRLLSLPALLLSVSRQPSPWPGRRRGRVARIPRAGSLWPSRALQSAAHTRAGREE